MSQVTSAMPSASTSILKLAIVGLLGGASVGHAVLVQNFAAAGFVVDLVNQIDIRIVRPLARGTCAHLEHERVAIGFIDQVMAVRNAGFEAGAVARLENGFAFVL